MTILTKLYYQLIKMPSKAQQRKAAEKQQYAQNKEKKKEERKIRYRENIEKKNYTHKNIIKIMHCIEICMKKIYK